MEDQDGCGDEGGFGEQAGWPDGAAEIGGLRGGGLPVVEGVVAFSAGVEDEGEGTGSGDAFGELAGDFAVAAEGVADLVNGKRCVAKEDDPPCVA